MPSKQKIKINRLLVSSLFLDGELFGFDSGKTTDGKERSTERKAGMKERTCKATVESEIDGKKGGTDGKNLQNDGWKGGNDGKSMQRMERRE